jgi:hypothetical protein
VGFLAVLVFIAEDLKAFLDLQVAALNIHQQME